MLSKSWKWKSETFYLMTRPSTYSATIILPRWSTYFAANLKASVRTSVHSSKVPPLLFEEGMSHLEPSVTSHWKEVRRRFLTFWEKLEKLISSIPKSCNFKWEVLVEMQASFFQCCHTASQKRASLNPCQNNHHGTYLQSWRGSKPLDFALQTTCTVFGHCSVRNSHRMVSAVVSLPKPSQ